jgi:hypothetical protein
MTTEMDVIIPINMSTRRFLLKGKVGEVQW